MKVKCIGGKADGDIIDVEDARYRENDLIQVMAKIEFSIVDFDSDVQAFREGRTPQSMTVPYHYYILKCFHWMDENKFKNKLYYLIPQNWNTWDAIQHLFKTHHAT